MQRRGAERAPEEKVREAVSVTARGWVLVKNHAGQLSGQR